MFFSGTALPGLSRIKGRYTVVVVVVSGRVMAFERLRFCVTMQLYLVNRIRRIYYGPLVGSHTHLHSGGISIDLY